MNTFDLIGAIEVTASAAIVIASLAGGLGRTSRTRNGIAAAFAAWFGTIVLLAATGGFDRIGVRGIDAAVIVPVALLAWAGTSRAGFRSAIEKLPLGLLIGVNTVRVLGASFIILHSAGRLAAPFAPVAGWGDIFVGLTALPIAWMVTRRKSGSRLFLLGWNSLGLADLVAAVGLGVTSAPNSPLRLFFAEPGTQIMGSLPWILIPGFLVPSFMLTHLAIFWKVRRQGMEAVPLHDAHKFNHPEASAAI